MKILCWLVFLNEFLFNKNITFRPNFFYLFCGDANYRIFVFEIVLTFKISFLVMRTIEFRLESKQNTQSAQKGIRPPLLPRRRRHTQCTL